MSVWTVLFVTVVASLAQAMCETTDESRLLAPGEDTSTAFGEKTERKMEPPQVVGIGDERREIGQTWDEGNRESFASARTNATHAVKTGKAKKGLPLPTDFATELEAKKESWKNNASTTSGISRISINIGGDGKANSRRKGFRASTLGAGAVSVAHRAPAVDTDSGKVGGSHKSSNAEAKSRLISAPMRRRRRSVPASFMDGAMEARDIQSTPTQTVGDTGLPIFSAFVPHPFAPTNPLSSSLPSSPQDETTPKVTGMDSPSPISDDPLKSTAATMPPLSSSETSVGTDMGEVSDLLTISSTVPSTDVHSTTGAFLDSKRASDGRADPWSMSVTFEEGRDLSHPTSTAEMRAHATSTSVPEKKGSLEYVKNSSNNESDGADTGKPTTFKGNASAKGTQITSVTPDDRLREENLGRLSKENLDSSEFYEATSTGNTTEAPTTVLSRTFPMESSEDLSESETGFSMMSTAGPIAVTSSIDTKSGREVNRGNAQLAADSTSSIDGSAFNPDSSSRGVDAAGSWFDHDNFDSDEDDGAERYLLFFDGNCSVLPPSALENFNVFLRVNLASKLYLLYDKIHVHSLDCNPRLEANVSFGREHRRRVSRILRHLVDTRSPIVEYGGVYFNLSGSHSTNEDFISDGTEAITVVRGKNSERSVRVDLGLGGDGGDVDSVLSAQEAAEEEEEAGEASLSKLELGLMVFLFTCGGLFLLLTLLLGVMKLSSIGLIGTTSSGWYPSTTSFTNNAAEDASLMLASERQCEMTSEDDCCGCAAMLQQQQQFFQHQPGDQQYHQVHPDNYQEGQPAASNYDAPGASSSTCCASYEVMMSSEDQDPSYTDSSKVNVSTKIVTSVKRSVTAFFNTMVASAMPSRLVGRYESFHQESLGTDSKSKRKFPRDYCSMDALCLQETGSSARLAGNSSEADASLHI